MGSDDATKRMCVLFSGRVQGVGFRFTVCRIAEQFCVMGYVKNLWDGDVELVAEGTETTLVDFLNAIRNSQLRQYIARDNVDWQTATGEFDRFGVSF